MQVSKSLTNIVDVLREFFPEKIYGHDYKVLDHGTGHFEIKADFQLPTISLIQSRSFEMMLDAEKQQAHKSVDEMHERYILSHVGYPTQTEKDTWSVKLSIAQLIESGAKLDDFSESFILNAGMATDADRQLWAASVIGKSRDYSIVLGNAEKIRAAYRKKINSCESLDEIRAVVDAGFIFSK